MKKRVKSSPRAPQRSICPISATLDLVGDKWTLLVVRDLLAGRSKYGELADSPEGVPTNILAERLKRLVAAGLVEKHAYQQNPPRYEYRLTEEGRSLLPVLRELANWGLQYVPGVQAKIRYDAN